MKQDTFFKKQNLEYGGALLNTRKGRARGRPIDTRNSMHLVLRSSKAIGNYSFRKNEHSQKIKSIVKKFSQKYGIIVHSLANVGNHIHFHVHIYNRGTYKPFIRAITAAIAMAVSGASRWCKSKLGKFWDYRPFTRVIIGYKSFLTVQHYIELNQLEGFGYTKTQARFVTASEHRYVCG